MRRATLAAFAALSLLTFPHVVEAGTILRRAIRWLPFPRPRQMFRKASQQQFTATVTNTTDTAVTWQVNGVTGGNATVGTINSSGLYTAPAVIPNPASVTITAFITDNSSYRGTQSPPSRQSRSVTVR